MSFLLFLIVNLIVSVFVLKISAELAYQGKITWGGAFLQLIAIGIIQFILAVFLLGIQSLAF